MTRNTNYAKGTVAENNLKNWLETQGCYAMRSAGSRGIADVLAIWPIGSRVGTLVDAIQVKSGQLPAPELISSLDNLRMLEAKHGVRGSLWHYLGRKKGELRWRVHMTDGYFYGFNTPVPERDQESPHEKQKPKMKSYVRNPRTMHQRRAYAKAHSEEGVHDSQ